jgi:hypothetical protein
MSLSEFFTNAGVKVEVMELRPIKPSEQATALLRGLPKNSLMTPLNVIFLPLLPILSVTG